MRPYSYVLHFNFSIVLAFILPLIPGRHRKKSKIE
jgi:uncharacterized membrane protein YagU involved in acid resistance